MESDTDSGAAVREIAALARQGMVAAITISDPDAGPARNFSKWTDHNGVSALVEIAPITPRLPTFITQFVHAADRDTFVRYIEAYDDDTTRIFVNAVNGQPASMLAILDYHQDGANRCAHRVTWPMAASMQWAAWNGINGKWIGQKDFGEFLEENLEDVVHPDAATVMETVLNLEAKKTVEFVSGVRLANGAIQYVYDEKIESKGRGNMQVPTELSLGIPVFMNGEVRQVRVLLRHQIGDDKKLRFQVKLHRAEKVYHDAVMYEVTAVGNATGVVPFLGRVA